MDYLAIVATILYFLHFPLPLAVGFFLWLRRRRVYYDFVAAIILLSMAAFVTYLLLPVGPPWYAAQQGLLPGPNGAPAITYLKPGAFDEIARFFGFQGNYLYSYAMYDISPNDVAAFPSLHAAYPTLAFLFARRAFGRVGWLMLGYAACVWFAVVYLGDHYLVDVLGGISYALLAYWAVIHAPGWFRRFVDRAADDEIGSTVEGSGVRDAAVLGRLDRHVRWNVIAQGIGLIVAGTLVTDDHDQGQRPGRLLDAALPRAIGRGPARALADRDGRLLDLSPAGRPLSARRGGQRAGLTTSGGSGCRPTASWRPPRRS